MTVEKFMSGEPFFSSWYIQGKLAEGKNSKVYKVTSSEDGSTRTMALKVIRFPGSNEEIRRALESERYATVDEYLLDAEKTVRENTEMMLSLKGRKNIVHFENYTIIKESSCFYLVILMELLTPLSECIKADSIKPAQVVKLGCDLCDALDHFRNAGIVHRSIKPENIYVDSDFNYKLGDFGIDDFFCRTNGPDGYTAPEGCSLTGSSDVYSLGVVLYKLLNNNRGPFLPAFPAPVSLADRELASVKRLRGDMLPAPANADAMLSRIIFTATAFEPGERYASPYLLNQALQDYISSLAAVAVPETVTPTVPVSPVPKNAGANVTDSDKLDFAEAFTDEDTEAEPQSYKKWYYIIGALLVVLALLVAIIVSGLPEKQDKDESYNFNDYYQSTEEDVYGNTSEEQTSEVSTTELTTGELTTEAPTTELTTEELTTEALTTELTTQEQTTEEPTTEPSTEEQTTEAEITAGSVDAFGRVYYELAGAVVILPPVEPYYNELTLELTDNLGENPSAGKSAYIYMTDADGYIIQRCEAAISLIIGDPGTYLCKLTIMDESFFYDKTEYSYYVLLPDGAIESDSSVSLESKIDF